jgi:uncharacterized membrane protein YciS (DUF1049 family)
MWVIRAVLIAVLLILIVAFAYNNFSPDQKVDVNLRPLLSNYVDVPLVTVVFWSFVAGIVLSLLLFITIYIRQTVDIHDAKKRIKALESEVAILRNRPIEESADLLKGVDGRIPELKSPFTEG